MSRRDFVNEVFKQLEENHIYLYHDISKQDFEKQKKAFLKDVDKIDEIHFQGGMLKLFALFKDAHLFYQTKLINQVYADIYQIEKDFFLKDDGVYKKITKVNGNNVDDVVEKLKTLVPCEVDTWAYNRIRGLIGSPIALKMIDCGKSSGKIVFGCGSQKITKTVLTDEQLQEVMKNKPREKWYEYKKLDDGKILYVKFAVCRDMEDYPFSKFVDDMTKSLDKKTKACIVDVRFNTGGSDVVVLPLVEYLQKNKIKTYGLMNNGTFSSGTFVLAYLKRDLNATLVGVEAGQPACAYGNINYLDVDGTKFSYCERYFELSSIENPNAPVKPFCKIKAFDYNGIIKPDIRIEMDINDMNKGIDTQLEGCLQIVRKNLSIINEKEQC